MNLSLRTKYLSLFTLIAITGATVFRETLAKVFEAGLAREDSSHTVFIPFIVLYFLWISKDTILKKETKIEWVGLVLSLFIIIISYIARSAIYQLHFSLFILFALAMVYGFLGRNILKETAFPLLFLVTATPIPEQLYNDIADFARTVALSVSLEIISFFGVPYHREGWLVQIPTGLLSVTINCSGIRYLLSYFVFSMAYAYLFKNTIGQRVITILCSIPISILASIFRLTAIFMLSYYVDFRLAGKWPHIFISWCVFVAVMAISIAVDFWGAGKMKRKRSKSLDEDYHCQSDRACLLESNNSCS